MEIAIDIVELLTSVVVLATAAVKLYTQSAEQKRHGGEKEGSTEAAADPSTTNGTAR